MCIVLLLLLMCMCYIAFNGYDIYLRVFMLSSMFHVFNGSFYRFACSFSLLLCGRLLLYIYIISVRCDACMAETLWLLYVYGCQATYSKAVCATFQLRYENEENGQREKNYDTKHTQSHTIQKTQTKKGTQHVRKQHSMCTLYVPLLLCAPLCVALQQLWQLCCVVDTKLLLAVVVLVVVVTCLSIQQITTTITINGTGKMKTKRKYKRHPLARALPMSDSVVYCGERSLCTITLPLSIYSVSSASVCL